MLTQTVILILVTAAVSIYAWTKPEILNRLILWPPAITKNHQYERLVTHGFIHADQRHLLFNMITLYFFGRSMEGIYDNLIGPWGFTLFYLGAIVFAILPTYAEHKNDAQYRSLGASGGVSAVLFAYILFAPWSTIYIYVIPVPAIIYALAYVAWTLYSAKQRKDNVNHSAHLWGAAYGVALTALLSPPVLGSFFQKLANH